MVRYIYKGELKDTKYLQRKKFKKNESKVGESLY